MAISSLRRALVWLACASATLLTACGSSTVESQLTPSRIIGFGDAFSVVTSGASYTVNDSATNTWLAQFAASYGKTLDTSLVYAQGNARISATPDAAGSTSTLTVTQQAEAALLGFTTNIPDATGSVLIQNGGVMGAVSGNMAKTIAVANLPAHNMTSGGHDAAAVTSSSAGAHDHFDPMYGWVDVDAIPTGVPVHCSDEGNRISLGGHTHTIDMPNHTHTVALGGSGTPLDTTPKSLSANAFLYLGT